MSDRAAYGLDLARRTHVHLIGIGGAGMSSIATVLLEMGHAVSGSDSRDSAFVESLRKKGATVFVGHRSGQLGAATLVVRSTAVATDNPELVEAESDGIAVLNRTEFLPLLAQLTPFVSISGTHGKTTTSSMTAVALTSAGLEPSFIVGSQIHSLGTSAGFRKGSLMVLEADESDGSFLAGPRAGALVTNIEADHLDYWGTLENLKAGFTKFLIETTGPRVVCTDDPILSTLNSELELVGYGFTDDAEYRITALEQVQDPGHPDVGSTVVSVSTPAGDIEMRLAVPGRYNALNATGALALAHLLGADLERVVEGLESYRGVARRFERRGSIGGVDFVDDYAHHPTELRAVLGAAATGHWRRVVATFQPHRFTRTESLWDHFATSFDGVDVLVVTDIYPAGESPRAGIDGRGLATAIENASKVGRVEYVDTLDDAADFLATELREGDLCLSLGAGDVTTLADRVIPRITTQAGDAQ